MRSSGFSDAELARLVIWRRSFVKLRRKTAFWSKVLRSAGSTGLLRQSFPLRLSSTTIFPSPGST